MPMASLIVLKFLQIIRETEVIYELLDARLDRRSAFLGQLKP